MQGRQTATDIPPLNLNSGLTLVAGKGPYRFRGLSQLNNQPFYLSARLELNRDGLLSASTEKFFQNRFFNDTA